MRRRPRPEPLGPLRSWTNPDDGEEWVAIHPLYRAVLEHYQPAGRGLGRLQRVDRLLAEIARGERRPPRRMLDRVLEIDREQQANGCPNENLAGLVELLQGTWTG